MIDYNEVFWTNVIRYQKLRKLSNSEMAEKTNQLRHSFVNAKSTRRGTSIKRLGLFARALDVQDVDLVEVWSDEEWEAYLKESADDEDDPY